MTKLTPQAADAIARALKPEKPTVIELMEENARLKAEHVNFAVFAAGQVATLSARVAELEAALVATRDDLNIRAVKGVVAVGNSVWMQINRALGGKND